MVDGRSRLAALASAVASCLAACSGDPPAATAPGGAAPDPATPAGREAAKVDIQRVYRCATGTNTMYLVFLGDGTYDLIAREHMFTARLEHGNWKREADGALAIERDGATRRLLPVEYRSRTFLSSPDHQSV